MVLGILRTVPLCSGPSSSVSSTRSRQKERKNARSSLDIPVPFSPLVTCQGKLHRLEVESASSSSVSSSAHQSELQIIQAPTQSLNDVRAQWSLSLCILSLTNPLVHTVPCHGVTSISYRWRCRNIMFEVISLLSAIYHDMSSLKTSENVIPYDRTPCFHVGWGRITPLCYGCCSCIVCVHCRAASWASTATGP
jgi:hypothetical protein